MKLRTVLFLAAASISLPSPAQPIFGQAKGDAVAVPLVRLISADRAMEGQLVRAVGVLGVGFEQSALYLSKEHHKHSIATNAIWLELSTEQRKAARRFSGQYVVVEGTFRAGKAGHLSAYPGRMTHVREMAAVGTGK